MVHPHPGKLAIENVYKGFLILEEILTTNAK